MDNRLSFDDSLKRVRKGKDDLEIVGGMIAEASLMMWLAKWSDHDLPWRLWEWSHELHLEHESQEKAAPNEIKALERARFFGAAGDLTVRRDGGLFRWHFIGHLPKKGVPEGHQSCHDFWQRGSNSDKKFTQFDQKALFWGAWNEKLERWYDDRVGFAKLHYPAPLRGLRHVYAHYWEFLDAGQVAFVWIYQLGDQSGEIPLDQVDFDEQQQHDQVVEPDVNDPPQAEEQSHSQDAPTAPTDKSKDGFLDQVKQLWPWRR